jgi:hypothetical protein
MEFFKIIDWYRTIPTVLLFFIFARLFYISFMIVIQRYILGKYEWNEQINPEKIKTCVVLFLIAVFFIWVTYKPFLAKKTSFDLWSDFFISTLGLAGVYLLIEIKIRKAGKSYLNNSFIDINTQPLSVVSSELSTTSLEGVSKTNKSLSFTTEDSKNDVQKGIIGDAEVSNQEEMQLKYQKDIEANDHTDVTQCNQEDNQPRNQQDAEECSSNDTKDGVNEETKSVGENIKDVAIANTALIALEINEIQNDFFVQENDTKENLQIMQDDLLANVEDIKLETKSRNFQERVTKQVHIKGTRVMPNPFSDDIIDHKIESIEKEYGIYCNIEDFKKLLKKDTMSNKILFKSIDNSVSEFSKVDYLKFLYFIFGDELLAHTSNTKIISWIKDNFDNENIGNSVIVREEISALRKFSDTLIIKEK